MASAEWRGGKCKGAAEAKAKMRHEDKGERLIHEHSNPDINLDLTPGNFSYRGLSYIEKCRAYDSRMAQLDIGRQSTGKNARVTMQGICIYAPKRLPEWEIRRWFKRVGDILNERYGENFIDMDVHLDEIHDYIDPDTGGVVTSRVHGHANIIPEVNGKLNCKQFSTRPEMSAFNDAVQTMTVREFGLQWNDGSKKKGVKTVEQLKGESLKAAEKKIQDTDRQCREKTRQTRLECDALINSAKAQGDLLLQKAMKMYQDAESRLKAENPEPDWNPDALMESCMKKRYAQFRRKDGSTFKMSYLDVIKGDMAAEKQRREQERIEKQRKISQNKKQFPSYSAADEILRLAEMIEREKREKENENDGFGLGL